MKNFNQVKTILIDTIDNYSSMDADALYQICDKFIDAYTDAKTRTFKNISVASLKNLIETVDSEISFASAMYHIDSLINTETDIIILEKIDTLEQDKEEFAGDSAIINYINSFENFNGFLKYVID